MASTTKSKKSTKSKPTVLPPPSKSAERVTGSDLESDSEENEEKQVQDKTYRYQPPEDFTPLSSDDAARDSNPFSAANLKGKQLWFFTAPATAPLSKLPSFSAADVAKGNAVLETKGGRGYCLKADEDVLEADAGVSIMAPDHKGVYRAVGQPITKAFRLVERIPQPPKISKDDVPERQPVRLQPEGLRMRFRPFGSVSDIDMATDDAVDVDRAGEAHAEEGSPERKKKRHKSSRDGEKKKKKHRSREE